MPKAPFNLEPEDLLESYSKILREAADVHDSKKVMSEKLVIQTLAVAMEINIVQMVRSKQKPKDIYSVLVERINGLLPMMKAIGDEYKKN